MIEGFETLLKDKEWVKKQEEKIKKVEEANNGYLAKLLSKYEYEAQNTPSEVDELHRRLRKAKKMIENMQASIKDYQMYKNIKYIDIAKKDMIVVQLISSSPKTYKTRFDNQIKKVKEQLQECKSEGYQVE